MISMTMDLLHDNGMSAIQSLQSRFQDQHGFFFAISNFGDPRYAFLLYAPLLYSLDWTVGRRLMWVTIIAEWSNQLLKWMLHGERPYWWVHETPMYNQTGVGMPAIRQYSLTCETGPGSPSGHAMVSAAIWYIIIDYLLRHSGAAQQLGKTMVSSVQWCVYTVLLCVVSLSRIYIAAHFPHQCIMGMIIGCCLAKLMCKLDTDSMTRRQYVLASIGLFASALLTYGVLSLMGVDPLWSVNRAVKWCAKQEYIHVDTTPFFSMMRYCSFPLGMGLGMTTSAYKKATATPFTWPMKIAAIALAVGAGKASELVSFPKSNVYVFYASAFVFNGVLAAVMFAFVPCLIAALSGRFTKTKSS
ncbi:glucose-6-phosphatase catalytic subunit 1-like [Ornithodoros turicata]|uniref:glucose-6-phosphatase catalytic subunit 1-like n=1 Tax=Ornithodoros turicata TaxID=34597 RepID=UPI00313A491B